MIEVLNQGRFDPMPVEEQVAVIFAGSQGYLDDLEIERIQPFLEDLREYLRGQHPEVLADIRERKEITAETEQALRDAIAEFHTSFAPEAAAPPLPDVEATA